MTTPEDSGPSRVGYMYCSEWLAVDQAMIDRFADATGDHQFIHVDPVAAAQTPFGGTVAHGFLTLSLLSQLHAAFPAPDGLKMGLNYGFDRVRFIHPVRAGSRIRAVSKVAAFEEKRPGQFQQTLEVTMEIEDASKPALTATWIFQFFA